MVDVTADRVLRFRLVWELDDDASRVAGTAAVAGAADEDAWDTRVCWAVMMLERGREEDEGRARADV